MNETIRSFVAIPIPDAVAAFLRQLQMRLQSARMKVRWVAIGNIHLTLKFLGDVSLSRVSEITAQMDAAAGSTPAFSLQARGVGVFPSLRKARVLWVGLTGDIDRLHDLQAGLESGLQSIGFDKDSRRFRAHLTIGRARQRIDAQTIGAALEPMHDVVSDSFRVDRLALIKSVLKPTGAQYTLLHTSHLQRTSAPDNA